MEAAKEPLADGAAMGTAARPTDGIVSPPFSPSFSDQSSMFTATGAGSVTGTPRPGASLLQLTFSVCVMARLVRRHW